MEGGGCVGCRKGVEEMGCCMGLLIGLNVSVGNGSVGRDFGVGEGYVKVGKRVFCY